MFLRRLTCVVIGYALYAMIAVGAVQAQIQILPQQDRFVTTRVAIASQSFRPNPFSTTLTGNALGFTAPQNTPTNLGFPRTTISVLNLFNGQQALVNPATRFTNNNPAFFNSNVRVVGIRRADGSIFATRIIIGN